MKFRRTVQVCFSLTLLALVPEQSFGDMIDFDTNPSTGSGWEADLGLVNGGSWRADFGVQFSIVRSDNSIQKDLYFVRQGDPGHAFSTAFGGDYVNGGSRNNFFLTDDDVIQTYDPGRFVMEFDQAQAYVRSAILDVDQGEQWLVTAFGDDPVRGAFELDQILITEAFGGDAEEAYFEFQRGLADISKIEIEYVGSVQPIGYAFDNLAFRTEPIPEPGAILLFGGFMLVGAGYRRARNNVS